MKQEQRRAIAADAGEDRSTVRVDNPTRKAFEHGPFPSMDSWRNYDEYDVLNLEWQICNRAMLSPVKGPVGS